MTYCQLEDPSGKKLPIQSKSCSYEIPHVTKYHDGIWRISYGIVGNTDPMTTFVNVTTYGKVFSSIITLFSHLMTFYNTFVWFFLDPVTTFVNYRETEKTINLLCQVRYEKKYSGEFKYCLFTRSDNFTLSVTPGVGNAK